MFVRCRLSAAMKQTSGQGARQLCTGLCGNKISVESCDEEMHLICRKSGEVGLGIHARPAYLRAGMRCTAATYMLCNSAGAGLKGVTLSLSSWRAV